jgi:hypothetical protein
MPVEVYTRGQLRDLLGVSDYKIKQWEEDGVLVRAGTIGDTVVYTSESARELIMREKAIPDEELEQLLRHTREVTIFLNEGRRTYDSSRRQALVELTRRGGEYVVEGLGAEMGEYPKVAVDLDRVLKDYTLEELLEMEVLVIDENRFERELKENGKEEDLGKYQVPVGTRITLSIRLDPEEEKRIKEQAKAFFRKESG